MKSGQIGIYPAYTKTCLLPTTDETVVQLRAAVLACRARGALKAGWPLLHRARIERRLYGYDLNHIPGMSSPETNYMVK